MMWQRSRFLTLAALVTGIALTAACGGGSGSNSTGGNTNSSASPAMVSAGDAPMNNVLEALVTVSAVTFTSSSGSVQLLEQPRKIELTHLGGIRAPLALHPLPFGTYNSVAVTISAAQITYIDSNGNPVTTNATIPSASATDTITLSPALAVSDTGATDIRFDFDLQSSLDLTGSTVTFTPKIGALVARVKDEDADAQRVHIDGTVTAVSTTANTITLTTADSGLSVTLNTNSSTKFDDNLALNAIQTGATLETVDKLNADGSLTALTVSDTDGGSTAANTVVDNGIVTAVTRNSSNDVTQFSMVVRSSLTTGSDVGKTLTVQVNSATVIKTSMNATNAGETSFDQSQIFAGQALWVAGAVVQGSTNTVLATEIRPAQVNPFGLTDAAVTQIAGGFAVPVLVDANTNFASFAQITTLTANTNSATVIDGQGLTSANVASLAVGTPVVARGFLSLSGSAATVFCTHLQEEGSDHPNH
ncbi:MAG TPA: DUF4382 domain-containing protein [Terriglobales bacterium]